MSRLLCMHQVFNLRWVFRFIECLKDPKTWLFFFMSAIS